MDAQNDTTYNTEAQALGFPDGIDEFYSQLV